MDEEFLLAEATEAAESLQHMRVGNAGRVKIRQPFNIRQLHETGKGVVFDIEKEVDDEYFGDDEDIYMSDETWDRMFDTFGTGEEAERSGPAERETHFDPKNYFNFQEEEEKMVDLRGDGSVKKRVIRQGTGKQIPERCKLFCHYMSLAEGSNEPFDTTLVRKAPYVVDLRDKECGMLPGLEIAIRSMELQELSVFIVVPALAYGKMGCPPRVPKNCKILFVVEALQHIDENLLATPQYMSSTERAELPFKVILKEVDKTCGDGNRLYVDKNYQFAMRKYRKARNMLEDYPTQTDEEAERRSVGLARLCVNIAQTYIKLDKAPQACMACKHGLNEAQEGDQNCVELLWRFAAAKLMLKDAEAAEDLVKKAARFAPDNKNVKKIQAKVSAEQTTQGKAFTDMCKRMFGGKDTSNVKKSETTSSASSTPKAITPSTEVLHPGGGVAPLAPVDNADENINKN